MGIPTVKRSRSQSRRLRKAIDRQEENQGRMVWRKVCLLV